MTLSIDMESKLRIKTILNQVFIPFDRFLEVSIIPDGFIELNYNFN